MALLARMYLRFMQEIKVLKIGQAGSIGVPTSSSFDIFGMVLRCFILFL